MPDWIWNLAAFVGLVSCYAILGSPVGGLFGPDRPDKADTHAFSGRGDWVRRIGMILLALLGTCTIVDYVAF